MWIFRIISLAIGVVSIVIGGYHWVAGTGYSLKITFLVSAAQSPNPAHDALYIVTSLVSGTVLCVIGMSAIGMAMMDRSSKD